MDGQTRKKYYPYVDLLKFIFSLLVVCIHVDPLSDVNQTANLVVSGLLASFAVPYFFVVSGYMSGNKSLMSTIRRPVCLCLICMVLYLTLLRVWEWRANFEYVLQLIFFSGGYFHLWYLVVLLYTIIICKTLFEKLPTKFCTIICVCTYLVGCIVRTYLEVNTTTTLFLFRLLSMGVPFFYYGMSVKKNGAEKKFASLKWFNCLFVLMWVVEVNMLMNKGTSVGYTLLFTTFPVVAIIFSYTVCLKGGIISNVSPMLGKMSMIVYCIHPAILWIIQSIASKLGIEKMHSLMLYLLVSTISCAVGVAYCFFTNIISNMKNKKRIL